MKYKITENLWDKGSVFIENDSINI